MNHARQPSMVELLLVIVGVVLLVCGAMFVSAHNAQGDTIAAPSAVYSLPETAAEQQAIREGKPCLVLVGADWCMPCKWIEAHYGPQIRARGVYVHINAGREPQPLRRILGVSVRALPTLIVVEKAKQQVIVGKENIKAWVEGK